MAASLETRKARIRATRCRRDRRDLARLVGESRRRGQLIWLLMALVLAWLTLAGSLIITTR